jgi:mannose-6-phosphate isomerase-like protein (cupin superfamily)
MPHSKHGPNHGTFWLEGDIKEVAIENQSFRKTVYSSDQSQLVVMSLDPNSETSKEKQNETDKILFIVKGKAESVLNGRIREARKHDVVFVPAGTEHHLKNVGTGNLKLIVIYSPPLYADGTLHITAEDATAAELKGLERAWEQ